MEDLTKTMTHKEIQFQSFLTQGGDSRLCLDPHTRLNPYLCTPFPLSQISIWSSCTSSPPSFKSYQSVFHFFNKLDPALFQSPNSMIAQVVEPMREQLMHLLGLRTEVRSLPKCDLIFSPSGTDAELIPLIWALNQSNRKIRNIFISPQELGQGSVLAGTGRFFNETLPNGNSALVGTQIEGMDHSRVLVSKVELRDEEGKVRSETQIQNQIASLVEESLQSDESVILHLVDASKTELAGPSLEVVTELKYKYSDRIDIVVDAAQGRWNDGMIEEYVRRDFFTLITGSKFFGGIPFCGAVLVPQTSTKRLIRPIDSELLEIYWTLGDLPPELRAWMNPKHTSINLGLILRWKTAIEEMNAYFEIPAEVRNSLLQQMRQEVVAAFQSCPCLELVGPVSSTQTIFTFQVSNSSSRENRFWLDQSQLLLLREKLFTNSFLIGRPVHISYPNRSALRIALSAPMVNTIYEQAGFDLWRSDLNRLISSIKACISS